MAHSRIAEVQQEFARYFVQLSNRFRDLYNLNLSLVKSCEEVAKLSQMTRLGMYHQWAVYSWNSDKKLTARHGRLHVATRSDGVEEVRRSSQVVTTIEYYVLLPWSQYRMRQVNGTAIILGDPNAAILESLDADDCVIETATYEHAQNLVGAFSDLCWADHTRFTDPIDRQYLNIIADGAWLLIGRYYTCV